MKTPLMPVDEALSRIIDALEPVSREQVSLTEARGRVLAADVVARRTQPPFDASAMDGYAVRAADVTEAPVTLEVVGSAPAGGAYDGIVGPGEAVRIFTGGPVPAGADSIVLQEDAFAGEGVVTLHEAAEAARHIRKAGLDFRDGDTVLAAGTRLASRHIGLAAAANVPELSVFRRPQVAILATGDELVPPGGDPGPFQIISSNSLAVAAQVEAAGGVAIDLGIARDDADSLKAAAKGAYDADLLVTIGGASVGDHDLIQSVLGEEGLKLDFWRIAMKPGKPLMFGALRGVPMLGLPGNPVSALVCGAVFLRPAVRRLGGEARMTNALSRAQLAEPLPANKERQDYLRARSDYDGAGTRQVTAFPVQDSSMLSTLAKADCLIVRPPHAPEAAAGDEVLVLEL
ncbi:MAG: molybdopterin molybdotransferase MoeA [Sphingomonadales bacterium]|nr:molybdopterin molybdotransferase MoeA [Sphingomonadales bacterium]